MGITKEEEALKDMATLLAEAYAHSGAETTRSFTFTHNQIPALEVGKKIYIVIKNQDALGTKELILK